MPLTIPTSPNGLYWNIRGNVRCEEHARELEPTRWESEGWQAIPHVGDLSDRVYQCQRCSPDGNPIRR
jgi:hypothetical protein